MRLLSFFVLALLSQFLFAQHPPLPELELSKAEVEAHIRFLASDELGGRYTGSIGNQVAARYIATQLEAYGYQSPAGADDYFQWIPFERVSPAAASTLKLHKTDFQVGEDFILLSGAALQTNATAVFAGHGWVDEANGHDDYANLDVTGKVVFVISGTPDSKDPRTVFRSMSIKRDLARARGAAALFEVYTLPFPWEFFKRYFGKPSMRLAEEGADDNPLVYGWIKDISKSDEWTRLRDGKTTKVDLSTTGIRRESLRSPNVIGVLEGTDPDLKKEFVLLSAHFDHVGIGEQGGGAVTPEDSIFNGARDNAMGTVALLSAAKTLSQQRPKRSVIVLAVTGEEIGLLGSQYYTEHPLLPLHQVVYNLNADGAGYNNTDYVAVFGYGRTGTDALVDQAAELVQLQVLANPIPDQGIYDRSDNVSFAAKGIPALSISPGTTAFDETVQKYYHQVADEADAVDMDYLLKYTRYFAHLARLVSNWDQTPFWIEGDKYEEAGKNLYER